MIDQIDRIPCSHHAAPLCTARLAILSTGLAVIKPTWVGRIPMMAILDLGIAGLAVGYWFCETWAARAMFMGIGAVLTVCALLWLAGIVGPKKVTFDRQMGRITGMSKISPEFRNGALEDVAAVQICSRYVEDPDDRRLGDRGPGKSYTAYELNLAFLRPEGKRINLICHARQAALREDAQELAEFLSIPLLDHSEEHSGRIE